MLAEINTITVAALLALIWLAAPRPGSRWGLGPGAEFRGLVRPLWWVNKLYCLAWHRLTVRHLATYPEQGPALLVANHTCAIDHMILQAGSRRMIGFLIARVFYDNPAFRPFCRLVGCIPVNRDGRDVAATRDAIRALGQGRVVSIFIEGRILPASGRAFGTPRHGAAYIALSAGVPVIPVYIEGTPKTVKFLGSLTKPSRARVTFGPPVDLSDFVVDGTFSRADVVAATDRLMGAIRDLRGAPAASAAGVR